MPSVSSLLGFLPVEAPGPLAQEVARASLQIRANQTRSGKPAIWVVCLGAVVGFWQAGGAWMLAWALPLAVLAEVNARVCGRILVALDQADSQSLRRRQVWAWWMTILNQGVAASITWWFGATGQTTLAGIGTLLQLIYVTAAMVNAASHPGTFIPGAWLNIGSAAVFWLFHGAFDIPVALALAGLGTVLTVLSLQMAKQFEQTLHMRFANAELVQQLAAEKKVVEEAVHAKSAFLSHISHEVRSPVGAIVSMADILRRTDLSTKQLEYLSVIEQCSEHLQQLLKQVLDLSRMEAGMLELESAPFNLPELLDRLQSMFAAQASQKGLSLEVVWAPGTPTWLQGDALRLSEVLINLVHNAVKFTERGGVDVHVHAEPASDGLARLHMTVRDTGMGLTAEQQQRLFRPFSQAEAATARQFGGSGLGLAISRQLVERMGGQMGVHSTPGGGSTFWVRIGLATAPAPQPS